MDPIKEINEDAAKFQEQLRRGEVPGRLDMEPTYEQKAQKIGKLVDIKQQQYGDSWGKAGRILSILFPDGVKPEQYPEMLGIVRVVDKLSRIANGNQGDENAWQDVAGYGLLGCCKGEGARPRKG